jgi:hypothetical protein
MRPAPSRWRRVDGPDGVAIALTPEAARVLGERLIAAADNAEA